MRRGVFFAGTPGYRRRYRAVLPCVAVCVFASTADETSSVCPMDCAPLAIPNRQGQGVTGAVTFGIEEEYFVVDAQTKLAAHDVPQKFFEAAKAATDGRVSTEFLQPQIE